MGIVKVKKRSGELVDFDSNKLNKWASWAACLGLDWSTVALNATKKCYDGCTTEELHQAMISTCIDMETIAYSKMAGRLYMGEIFKKVFNGIENIPTLKDMYRKMVEAGHWDSQMNYSDDELDTIGKHINHDLDMQATHAEVSQIISKYALVDRIDGLVLETPQFVYARMALGNMASMPKERRVEDVIKLYHYLSEKKINAPSPFFTGLGTPKRHYASCCVTTTEDTASSLAAADHISYMMTCASAGIGTHLKTRSKGDKVRGGLVKHQGKLPYFKMTEAAVAANKQSSRGGSATAHFNVLDPEIRDLLALKNIQTVEQKRIKDIDYSVGYNHEFARRAAKNDSWMLVSYGDAPELYEAMYEGDQTKFLKLYAEVEADDSIKKEFIPARDIAIKMLREWVETGRVYHHRTDEMNRHTPFKDKIYSSNLCVEIALPTKGYSSVEELYKYEEGSGEIGLCSLSAIVLGNVSDEEYEDVAYYTCLMIDNVISLMDYPFHQLAYTATKRRSLGVGLTNLAYEMAKNGYAYSSLAGKKHIHYLAERHSYWLHKASLRLGKELGNAEWIHKTKYPEGWLPIDTYNKEVDNVVGNDLKFDWESLRKEIVSNGGIRHSVLEAHMPCESSAVASNSTNGLYPVRALKLMKTSGTNKQLFIAPDAEELQWDYQLAWDIKTKDLVDCYAIIQKFTGQGISADFYLSYGKSVGEKSVSAKELIADFLYMTKMGLKTKYYCNSSTSVVASNTTGATIDNKEDSCAGGGCAL